MSPRIAQTATGIFTRRRIRVMQMKTEQKKKKRNKMRSVTRLITENRPVTVGFNCENCWRVKKINKRTQSISSCRAEFHFDRRKSPGARENPFVSDEEFNRQRGVEIRGRKECERIRNVYWTTCAGDFIEYLSVQINTQNTSGRIIAEFIHCS